MLCCRDVLCILGVVSCLCFSFSVSPRSLSSTQQSSLACGAYFRVLSHLHITARLPSALFPPPFIFLLASPAQSMLWSLLGGVLLAPNMFAPSTAITSPSSVATFPLSDAAVLETLTFVAATAFAAPAPPELPRPLMRLAPGALAAGLNRLATGDADETSLAAADPEAESAATQGKDGGSCDTLAFWRETAEVREAHVGRVRHGHGDRRREKGEATHALGACGGRKLLNSQRLREEDTPITFYAH